MGKFTNLNKIIYQTFLFISFFSDFWDILNLQFFSRIPGKKYFSLINKLGILSKHFENFSKPSSLQVELSMTARRVFFYRIFSAIFTIFSTIFSTNFSAIITIFSAIFSTVFSTIFRTIFSAIFTIFSTIFRNFFTSFIYHYWVYFNLTV